jgi:hypothetical protein
MVFNGSDMKMGRLWFCFICNLKGVGGSKRKEIFVKILSMCREISSKKYKEVTFVSISEVWYRGGNDTLK